MADELITQTSDELQASNQDSEAQKRIKQLSEKVRLTSEERDEKDKVLKETNDKLATLEKENAFNSSFLDILGTLPAAKDHKDEIKAKVLAGYSPEDAAFAVLGKAGQLGNTPAPAPASPAGGSASNTISGNADKPVGEMTLAEKRAELEKSLLLS